MRKKKKTDQTPKSSAKKHSNPFRPSSRAMALEPRVLYDGAAGAILADALVHTPTDTFHSTEITSPGPTSIHSESIIETPHILPFAPETSASKPSQETIFINPALKNWEKLDALLKGLNSSHESNFLSTLVNTLTHRSTDSFHTTEMSINDFTFALESSSGKPQHEIIFIDPAVENYEQLAALLKASNPTAEMIFLDGAGNGINQIADALSSRSGITAIHIISHGESGGIRLGNTTFSSASISEYASELTRIGSGLTAEGDILIYGCDVAKGETGNVFISALAKATGADIAASDNPTGAAGLGGDWILEQNTGNIEVQILAPLQYNGLLAPPTVTSIVRQTPTYDTTNADSVIFRVTFSEAVQNVDGTDFTIAPGSVSGATVQLVVPIATSNGTQFDVYVGGLSGTTGPLNLDVSNQQNITSVNSGEALSYTNPTGGNPVSDQSYTVDHSVATPILTAITTDTGASSSDFITSDNTLIFSGTADPNCSIRLYSDGVFIGTTTSNGSGVWSIDHTATPLTQGAHSLIVTATDASGNVASASPLTVTVDTTAPAITGATVSDIIVVLTYNDTNQLDAVNKAGTSAFTVRDNGTIINVTNVSVNESNNTIMLTLASPVTAGHTVTVSYADPTGGDDASAVQDKAGNDAATITNYSITNTTNASDAAPVIGNVSGSTWFSKGDNPVPIFSSAPALTDADDTYLENATITITTNRQTNDALSISGTLPSSITATAYNSTTGVLQLSGHATLADYQTALAQIRFANSTGQSIDTDRTITVTVNDGQTNSATVTRTMHVLGPKFYMGQTTTAYLVGNATGGAGMDLSGVNLVMGTITYLSTDFTTASLNGMGFSPVDGHLYASDNDNSRIVRINSDYTVNNIASFGGTNAPPAGTVLYSGDISSSGVLYMHALNSTTIYRLDVNPESSSYRQWIAPITMSQNTGDVDMAFSPIDGQIYTVSRQSNQNRLYRINPSTGTTALLGTITNGGASTYYPMQYFDTNGYLYYTAGGANPTVYRINLSNPSSPDLTATPISFSTTLPTTGDGGRIVSINLDFGDAPNGYLTTLASNGPRHSQLGNTAYLGTAPDIEADGPAAGTGTTDDTTGSDDENGITTFDTLRANATSYSTNVNVTNTGSSPVTVIGWIDFDKNGSFDTDEVATATVAPGTVNGTATLTWSGSGMTGMTSGNTYARVRIGTTFVAPGAGPRDARSYGPMMDGEVEDYAITIAAPDLAAPAATIAPVSPDPRHTPVNAVTVTFADSSTLTAEAVTGVDIADFTLTRDGNPVSLSGIAVTGSGSTYTLDLSSVTSPAGVYLLTLNASGSGITDNSGNALASNAVDTFTVDTTAPVIDLDPADPVQRNYTTTSVNGAAVSLDDNASAATLVEASDSLTQLTLQPGGLRNGSSEILTFGSLDLMANGGSGAQTNITVGGVAIDIAWSSGVFTLTKNGGGNFTQAEAQAVIRDIQYRNDAVLLTPGNRTFTFKATDLAGITSDPTVCSVTTTDTIDPAVPVVTGITNDTGTVGDHITSDTTLYFNGTAEANSTVEVFVDGVSKGFTTADDSGAWSFDYTTTTLANGTTYQVTATSRDASLNTSAPSAPYAVTIDTNAPAITGISNDTGVADDFRTNDQTLVFYGTAGAGDTVTVILHGSTLGTTTADGSGNWSYDYTGTILAPGSYVLTVQSGASPQDSQTIVVDTSAPLLTATTPLDNAIAVGVGNNITMTFNENILAGSGNLIISNGAGDTRTIDINDSTQISISGNTLTVNPTYLLLKNTDYYVQLASGVIKDTAGNNYAGIIDTTTFNFRTENASPPIITNVPENSSGGINALEASDGTFVVVNLDMANTGAVAGNTLTINWGEQTVNYTLLAADITANSATVFIPYATIDTQGNGSFNVTAKIGAGPTSDPYPVTVTVDLIAPPITPTVTPLSTNDTTPTITGTATLGTGESLTVTLNGVTYTVGDGNLTYDSVNSTWSLTIPGGNALDEWTYPVTATVTDAVGNTTSDTTTNELVIDLTSPSVPTVVSQPAISDNTPTITGTANVAAGEYLTVTVNGVTYTEGDGNLVRVSTNWTLTIPNGNALPDGTYNVVATTYDAAGNNTSDVTTNELVIDTTPPDVNVVSITTDSGVAADFITNDQTLSISGSFNAADTNILTVSFNGNTYTLGTSPELTAVGNVWTLDATGVTLTEGIYPVVATATDLAGNSASDTQNVTIDITAPTVPTVNAQATNDTTPIITGTATVGAGETLIVTVNGTTYTVGDGNLTYDNIAHTWSLTIPGNNTLPDGTYPVTATVTDMAANTSTDVTTNELVIDTTAPVSIPPYIIPPYAPVPPSGIPDASVAVDLYLVNTVSLQGNRFEYFGDYDEQVFLMNIDHAGELIRPVIHEFPDKPREGMSDLFAQQYGVGNGREFIRPVIAEASARFFDDRKIHREWFVNRLFEKVQSEDAKTDRPAPEQKQADKPSEKVMFEDTIKHQRDEKTELIIPKWTEEVSLPESDKHIKPSTRPEFSAQIKAAQNKYYSRNLISLIKN